MSVNKSKATFEIEQC